MLDRPQDQEKLDPLKERIDPEDASEADLDSGLGPKEQTSWLDRLSPGSLTTRIGLINLLGLIILVSGILYSNQYRQGLIEARTQSLRTQAHIISGAIAGSATLDTGNIVINPESLDDSSDSATSDTDQFSGLDFPISPETAGPVLRRLLANSNIRARIIDQEGNLLVDSRFLYGGNDIEVNELETTKPEPHWYDFWNTWMDWIFSSDYPPYVDYGFDGNRAQPEVASALNGSSVSIVRLNENREIVISVAVPVQRYRSVLGSLILTTQGGEIDAVVRSERNAVLLTFLFSTLVTLLLSALLAATIASPVRKLSAAADRVRRAIAKREEIPDFTSRKDEIGNLSGSFREMTHALYKRIDAIEAFAADVSHELKNPLTSLRSAVETLGYVKKDEDRKKLIAVVIQDVKRMDRLISDISDASRLDAELARSEANPIDISKLAGAIVEMSNATKKDGEAEVMLHVQPITAARDPLRNYMIQGQDSRLAQVLRNLIDNARSFTAAGANINMRLRRVGDEVEVRVEDHGPGIAPENLERVFERFYTDRPAHSFGKNSGLGLAISRQIVEAHKGRIWAENRMGRVEKSEERKSLGARFVVRLPAVPSDWLPPQSEEKSP